MREQAAIDGVSSPPSSAAREKDGLGLEAASQPIKSLAPEKFIPVDRKDIISQVLDKQFQPGGQRALAGEVLRYICILRQAESAKSLDELVELYDAFNPDDETVNLVEISAGQRKLQLEALKKSVIDLVSSANYIEIDQTALEKILEQESGGGFLAEVDLSDYDFHLLYYRGLVKDMIRVKSWKRLWLFEHKVEAEAYRRLFIGLKLKPLESRVAELIEEGMTRRKAERLVRRSRNHQMLEGVSEHTLHLKVFRLIPKSELEILFPNARIRFTLFDKLWLWLGSGGSTVFAIVMAALKFVAAVAISLFFVLITIAGAVGAIFRTVTSFFNTRTRYMAKLAKSLYFHNIGSNQSVLTLLTDEAEEEDIKEAILTYALLLRHGHRGLDAVKYEAEKFLKDEFDVECDFDIEDGCVHLRVLGLLVEDDHGNPRIRDLHDAREHLASKWNSIPTAA
jgi:Protein of unknown function (DUF3754)